MASIELHKEQIREHIQEINDAIAIGIEKRPATIGLHTSACAISLLEAYLHGLGKISTGTMVKHEWFKQPKINQKIAPLAERKIGVDFPHKEEILLLMYAIEDNRNKMIYGKSTKAVIVDVLESFQKLHQIIKESMKERGIEIE
ncbi:hypothetical protein HY638_03105 [Candidatus Woesearchaeota archaeon]|nr:hypothetical protein [Candidatus Woesearchaeota archaeon]